MITQQSDVSAPAAEQEALYTDRLFQPVNYPQKVISTGQFTWENSRTHGLP
jgi:hypothetical protein